MSNCDLVTKHKTRKIYETVTLEVGYTIQTGNVITGDWWTNLPKVSILGVVSLWGDCQDIPADQGS